MPEIDRPIPVNRVRTRADGDSVIDFGIWMQIATLMRNSRFQVTVLLSFVCLVNGLHAADRDPAMERLQSLATSLQTRATWTASYTQEYLPPEMTFGEEVEGRVWVGWPDKALFATGKPILRWMGLSGRLVRLLDFENASCDDHLLTDEEWERIPLVAVLDPQTAVEQFSIIAEGEHGLILIPRTARGVARISIEIGQDGLPQRVAVTDPLGAVSTFDFVDWRSAIGPPDKSWLPAPPEQIECIGDRE